MTDEELFCVDEDEAFCDCCNVLWKRRVMTEIALTGLHLCPVCIDHQDQDSCPLWSADKTAWNTHMRDSI